MEVALEKARRKRLRSLGVSDVAMDKSELKRCREMGPNCIRVMQWNLLADGMSDDGFLVSDIMQDWPAGVGNVPTCDGQSVKFDALLAEIMEARGNEEALEKLKQRYNVPASATNAKVTVDWQARELQIQLQVLAAGRPDFLVFQECDNYGPLSKALANLGYSSALPGSKPYEPAHLIGYDTSTPEGVEEFRQAIDKKGCAFLPSVSSTAMNIQLNNSTNSDSVIAAAQKLGLADRLVERRKILKKGFAGLPSEPLLREAQIDPYAIDDDGVAIFWRADRFSVLSLNACLFPCEPNSFCNGTLRLRFRESAPAARELTVFGVHLASGDDLKSEARRLKTQVDVEGGLRDMAQDARREGSPVIVCMDANSHPQIGADSGKSVWCSLLPAVGASVWDDHFDTKGNPKISAPPDPPVTSNKLRGPLSGQAKKIGLHSYYCIDHIFFTPGELSLQGHAVPPKQFSSDADARRDINPSLSCPSDHYPVVVDLAWALPSGTATHENAPDRPSSLFSQMVAGCCGLSQRTNK